MDRKNYTDLIEAIQAQNPDSRENIDLFARTFFETITEGLAEDKFVKIKGIGTFKTVEVSSRDSVDINTGNRIKIGKHAKITFTPDAYFRDMINKPFAHLQSVIINEGTDVNLLSKTDVERPDVARTENIENEEEGTAKTNNNTQETEGKEITQQEDNLQENSEEIQPQATFEEEDAQMNPEPRESYEYNTTVDTEPPVFENNEEEETIVYQGISRKKFAAYIVLTAVLSLIIGFYVGSLNLFGTKQNIANATTSRIPAQNQVVQKTKPKATIKKDTATIHDSKVVKKKEPVPIMPMVDGDTYMITGEQEVHVLKQGENITQLAKQIYGHKSFAKYIIRFNNISDPDMITVGTKLRIPKLVNAEKQKQ